MTLLKYYLSITLYKSVNYVSSRVSFESYLTNSICLSTGNSYNSDYLTIVFVNIVYSESLTESRLHLEVVLVVNKFVDTKSRHHVLLVSPFIIIV